MSEQQNPQVQQSTERQYEIVFRVAELPSAKDKYWSSESLLDIFRGAIACECEDMAMRYVSNSMQIKRLP